MILFVCSVARLRSRTAELLCLFGGLEARSAGTSEGALNELNDQLLKEADIVFCMEHKHRADVSKFANFQKEKTFVLNIEDEYDRLEPYLVKSLIRSVSNVDENIGEKMRNGYEVLSEKEDYLKNLGTFMN